MVFTKIRRNGFSLVDVLVAVSILITMAVLMGVFAYTQIVRRAVNYEVIASRVATDTLEELKDMAWEELAASGTIDHGSLGLLPQGHGVFTVAEPTASGTLRETTVEVFWQDRGAERSYRQTTYVSEYGI